MPWNHGRCTRVGRRVRRRSMAIAMVACLESVPERAQEYTPTTGGKNNSEGPLQLSSSRFCVPGASLFAVRITRRSPSCRSPATLRTNGPPGRLISRRFNVFNPAKIVDNLLLPILSGISVFLFLPCVPLRFPISFSTPSSSATTVLLCSSLFSNLI